MNSFANGKKKYFYIECKSEKVVNPDNNKYVLCNTNIWINDIRLTLDNLMLASDMLCVFYYANSDCGKRRSAYLNSLNEYEFYNKLYEYFYINDDEIPLALEEMWARFHIHLAFEGFVPLIIFAREFEDHTNLVMGHKNQNDGNYSYFKSINIPGREFEKTIQSYYKFLESIT